MPVNVTVSIVVDDTARRTHQHRADNKDERDVPGRITVPRDPYAPQRRPQQQQNADGAVQTGELDVEGEAFGEIHGAILTRIESLQERRDY